MSHSTVAPWRRTAALIALVILAVVAGISFWPSPSSQAAAASGHSVHAAASASAATSESAATSDSKEVASEKDPKGSKKLDVESAPKSTVGKSKEVSLGAAASQPTADDPVVRDKNALKGKRGDVLPSSVLGAPGDALGGCLVEYGKDGECLSTIPPSQSAHAAEMTNAGLDPLSMDHTWTCKEVRLYFPKGVEVRQSGVDPQGLDEDGNGVACSAKD